jgi:hypothetical protein
MLNHIVERFREFNYKSYEVIPGVVVVENFITEKKSNILIKFGEDAAQNEWETEYYDNFVKFCEEKFGRTDVDNLLEEGLIEITNNWIDKIISVNQFEFVSEMTKHLKEILSVWPKLYFRGFGVVQRQYEGVPLIAHTDIHTDKQVKYAAILYLNDDYVDGEVYWVKKDFKIKPKKGSLLIFPGGEEFEHGVEAPGKGPTRYVMPSFIYGTDGIYEF